MDGDEYSSRDFVELGAYRALKTGGMINAKVRGLYEYWNQLRAGRLAPMRADVDPRDMPHNVSHVFIVEALNPANIRFRVAGSELAKTFGMELRGMTVRAIMAQASRESFSALIAETLEDPGVGYARLSSANNPDAQWEIVLLPLRSEYGGIDRLLGALMPITDAAPRGTGPLHFRIDHMRVESITPTVLDAAAPHRLPGFAEAANPFDFTKSPPATAKPKFTSIEGGRSKTEEAEPRNRAHLRLVDD